MWFQELGKLWRRAECADGRGPRPVCPSVGCLKEAAQPHAMKEGCTGIQFRSGVVKVDVRVLRSSFALTALHN